LIDRQRRPALQLGCGGVDGFQQGGVVHAATDLISSFLNQASASHRPSCSAKLKVDFLLTGCLFRLHSCEQATHIGRSPVCGTGLARFRGGDNRKPTRANHTPVVDAERWPMAACLRRSLMDVPSPRRQECRRSTRRHDPQARAARVSDRDFRRDAGFLPPVP
jgi:hypothetical protein